MSRLDDLALAAAAAFEDMRSPFETNWLVEHSVTADECFDLSNRIANAIRAFQVSDPLERAAAAVAGELPPDVRDMFLAQARLISARKKLGSVRGARPPAGLP